MSEETNKGTTESQASITEEQIAQEMADSAKFYETHIPYLTKVYEYESLKANIAEARYREIVMKAKLIELKASMMANPNEKTKKDA